MKNWQKNWHKNWHKKLIVAGACCIGLTMPLQVCAAQSSAATAATATTDVTSGMAITAGTESSMSPEEQMQPSDAATTASTMTPPTVQSVDEARNGILQVNSVYVDDSGSNHIVLGGAGFLIGSPDGDEYIITTNSVVAPGKKTRDAAFKYYKVPDDNGSWDNISLKTQVVVESDVVIDASVMTASTELNIAVLKLDQPIYNKTPLTILTADNGTNDKPYKVTDPVYSLGFPAAVRFDKNPSYYDGDQVSMSSGTIANLTTRKDIQVIQHDAQIAGNNCGGPLVDANGYVIGVNELIHDGNYYYSIDSTELVRILDALGIQYNKLTTSQKKTMESEESVTAVAATVTTQIVTPEPEKTGLPHWVIALICVLLLVIAGAVTALIVIVNYKKSGVSEQKEEKKADNAKKKETSPSGRFDRPQDRFGNSSQTQSSNSGTGFSMQKQAFGGSAAGSSMETSVLGRSGAAGETSVLGDQKPAPAQQVISGTLIRRKSGENVIISKPYFRIGKDSLHVDFCIKDNSSVSRMHAAIRTEADGIFLEDCGSTNGTFLNGTQVMKEQPQQLHSGDMIRLANEELEYRQ